MTKFWLVWCELRSIPRYKHDSELSARQEAERLAKENPGSKFHVLQLIDTCRIKLVMWASEADDDIPF